MPHRLMPAFPIWDLHRLAPEVRPDLPGLSTLAIYYVQYGPKSPNTQHLLSLFPLSTIQLQGFFASIRRISWRKSMLLGSDPSIYSTSANLHDKFPNFPGSSVAQCISCLWVRKYGSFLRSTSGFMVLKPKTRKAVQGDRKSVV